MAYLHNNPLVRVSDCELDIDVLLASCEIDVQRSSRACGNLVVIVPLTFQREEAIISFPAGTLEFYQFIQENLAGDAIVEIASKDEGYTEIALHSVDIFLPAIYFASYVILPLAINLISSYISTRLFNRKSSNNDNIVHSTIHCEDVNGKKVTIEYVGPSSTFENVVSNVLRGTGGEQQ